MNLNSIVTVKQVGVSGGTSIPARVGIDGHSPYIGENDNWWEYNDTLQIFEDTGVKAQGDTGDKGDKGEDGKSAYESYVETTTDDPVLSEQEWANIYDAKEDKGVAESLVTQLIDGATSQGSTLKRLEDRLLTIEAILGDAAGDDDDLINTIRELLAVFSSFPEGSDMATLLSAKVNVTDIYNALDCVIEGKVLDARQGKVLSDALTSLQAAVTSLSNSKAEKTEVQALYNALTQNYLPKWNGTKFVNTALYELNGNIGIGTTNPLYRVEIIDSNANSKGLKVAAYRNDFLSSNGAARFLFIPGNANGNAILRMYDNAEAEKIAFNTGGYSYINSGNVGIGTNTPSEKLSILGNLYCNGTIKLSSTDGTAPNAGFFRHNASSTVIAQYGINTGTAYDDFGNADNAYNGGLVRVDGRTTQPTIQFLTRVSGDASYPTPKMVIDKLGNIGIGITAPTNKLHIQVGPAGFTGNSGSAILLESNTHNYINLISAPNRELGILMGSGSNGGSGIFWQGGTRGNYIELRASNTTHLVMTDVGNVGIGTTSPSAILHLKAGVATSAGAPLKFTAGVVLTVSEVGAVEFTDDGTNGHFYITMNVAGVLTRREIAFIN